MGVSHEPVQVQLSSGTARSTGAQGESLPRASLPCALHPETRPQGQAEALVALLGFGSFPHPQCFLFLPSLPTAAQTQNNN